MRFLLLQLKYKSFEVWLKVFEYLRNTKYKKNAITKYFTQILSFYQAKIQNTNSECILKMYFKYMYFLYCPTLVGNHMFSYVTSIHRLLIIIYLIKFIKIKTELFNGFKINFYNNSFIVKSFYL